MLCVCWVWAWRIWRGVLNDQGSQIRMGSWSYCAGCHSSFYQWGEVLRVEKEDLGSCMLPHSVVWQLRCATICCSWNVWAPTKAFGCLVHVVRRAQGFFSFSMYETCACHSYSDCNTRRRPVNSGPQALPLSELSLHGTHMSCTTSTRIVSVSSNLPFQISTVRFDSIAPAGPDLFDV